MAQGLNNIERHIPDEIKSHKPVEKMLKVLQGMVDYKQEALDEYAESFLYPMVYQIEQLRRWVDNFGGEYLESTPRPALDCLIRHSAFIFASKGTLIGLQTLLLCLVEDGICIGASVAINSFELWKPLILFDDDRPYDVLPEGVDLEGELITLPPLYAPTLLDDTWEDTKSHLTMTINTCAELQKSYRIFLHSILHLYVPMIARDNLVFNITYIPTTP